MSNKLGEFIEKTHIKFSNLEEEKLPVYGVSNISGITTTSHKKSEDLSNYLLIENQFFAYNPYRVNVGSLGLTDETKRGLVSPAYIVFKIKNQSLIPEFLLDFLKSTEGLRQINQKARGTVRKALRYEDLCEIDIPSLTYQEQLQFRELKKYYDRELDDLHQEISHQEDLLKKLRQAILQEAISGKLTADWRAENLNPEPASELLERIKAEKDKIVSNLKLRKTKLNSRLDIECNFPETWEHTQFANVGAVIGGVTKNAAKRDGLKTQLPYLRVANVYANRLNLEEVKEIGILEKELDKYLLNSGDLLVVEGNGSKDQVGRIAIWDGSIAPCLHQNHVIKVRLGDPQIGRWLLIWFLSPAGRKLVEEQAKTSTGLYNLSSGKVSNLNLPLPPIKEQHAIVEKVESLMALCDEMEQEIQTSKQHAQDLLQAVLREAFNPS